MQAQPPEQAQRQQDRVDEDQRRKKVRGGRRGNEGRHRAQGMAHPDHRRGQRALDDRAEVSGEYLPVPDGRVEPDLGFGSAVAADVARRRCAESCGQLPEERGVSAGAESVAVQKVGRSADSTPIQVMQAPAVHIDMAFDGLGQVSAFTGRI